LGRDPETDKAVYLRKGRYGAYVQLGEAGEGEEKPKTASLLQSQKPEELTFEQAVALLSLPRVVGVDPEDGQEITATNGRYGAYITKGTENRSLESDAQIFTITVPEAVELLKQPKQRRQRAAAQSVLKTLGDDPVSGKPITLRAGRFGHYVTDGITNASLRAQDDPASIAPERAHELLQLRREYDAAKGKTPGGGKRGGGGKRKTAKAKTTKAKAAKEPKAPKAPKAKKAKATKGKAAGAGEENADAG
ncbi:MAG: hypothetical protein KC417_04330, partial [Myxococcales bacterium]|nr:hypothetical protein [Myxococcales bacterium]